MTAGPWLVSARFDLAIFLGPVLLSVLLVALEPWLSSSGGQVSLPMWLIGVLAVDVAHVWATLFVTYLDPGARRRFHRALWGAPLGALLLTMTLAHAAPERYWRVLAYVAVFHFVRQQYGWVRLYQQRERELPTWERRLDVATVYAGALYPVVWWHAHLPRRFTWFAEGDFVTGWVSEAAADGLLIPYLGVLLAFTAVQLLRQVRGRPVAIGKAVVVWGTAVCWGLGICLTDTDWSFTVSNVFLHGVPYMAFVWVRARVSETGPARAGLLAHGAGFYGVLLGLAYAEEWGWDRLLWHEGLVFPGPEMALGRFGVACAMALLSVPQVTHYLLDGIIWRRTRA